MSPDVLDDDGTRVFFHDQNAFLHGSELTVGENSTGKEIVLRVTTSFRQLGTLHLRHRRTALGIGNKLTSEEPSKYDANATEASPPSRAETCLPALPRKNGHVQSGELDRIQHSARKHDSTAVAMHADNICAST